MTKYLAMGLTSCLLVILGCTNIFKSSANQSSDEAQFEEIQKSVDSGDYDSALSALANLSSSYKSRSDVVEVWASAYAGKCGLNFLQYIQNLEATSISSTTMFKYLMNAFTGVKILPAYCDLAQTKIEEISALPAGRTQNQNYFMAVLGMVKMGVYLRNSADVLENGGLGNGVIDAGYDSCAAGSISDANLSKLITGMGLLTTNLSVLTGPPFDEMATALTPITTLCGASCSKTDPATVDAVDRALFRDILKTGSGNPTLPAGIESCNDPLVAPCC